MYYSAYLLFTLFHSAHYKYLIWSIGLFTKVLKMSSHKQIIVHSLQKMHFTVFFMRFFIIILQLMYIKIVCNVA